MAYVVGLTGGIGSGKSTVCAMLAERGAKIIDADAIVHELQRPGTEVFDKIVEAFGTDILTPDGTLDRAKLASIVFADPEKRKLLESIVWPAVGVRVVEDLQALKDDDIAVLDVPLMAESPEGSRRNAASVIVVDAAPDTQLRHLETKGVPSETAKARMAAQVSREERLKIADHVLTNDGGLGELEKQVDELWRKLQKEAAG
ncbi:MAG: dephospho-CoA kinase [Actinomycetota bacterium]